MTDDKQPRDPSDAEPTDKPKKAGFGAFADQYRDRWASGHPNAKKPERSAPAAPAAPPAPPTAPRAADGDAAADGTPGT